MANPTTNFGWQMPTSTDLVTDLPADFEVFGQAVDTSLADLKGGTTGQVLSKASNTDMDFTWVAQDDSNAIQNAIVDAKGDLIAATGADTPARLAVGTNGQVLSADSTASTGLAWTTISTGGMTQLATGTLSGSQVDITSISGSYKNLQLVIRNMKPTDDGGVLRIRVNNDSGTTYRDVAAFSVGNTSAQSEQFNVGDVNDNAVSQGIVIFNLYDYANTTTYKVGDFKWLGNNSTSSSNFGYYNYNEIWASTSAITQINLFLSPGGNFNGGTYFLYGVK